MNGAAISLHGKFKDWFDWHVVGAQKCLQNQPACRWGVRKNVLKELVPDPNCEGSQHVWEMIEWELQVEDRVYARVEPTAQCLWKAKKYIVAREKVGSMLGWKTISR